MSFQVTVLPERRVLQAAEGAMLTDVLKEAGLSVTSPCGGRGACGKCLVICPEAPVTTADRNVLPEQLREAGYRLACRLAVRSDLEVVVPELSREGRIRTGRRLHFVPSRELFDRYPDGLGAAVDLGTTTIAFLLFDYGTGRVLDVRSDLNPQARYGDDLMSRIERAIRSPSARVELRQAALSMISQLARESLEETGSRPENVRFVTIAGNTAMQHLLLGTPVESLSVVPFTPVWFSAVHGAASEIGIESFSRAEGMVFPNIGGFVGGDTVAGILAAGLATAAETSLLIDIGTNGEIVLSHGGRLYTGSAAAGPAFEGARISSGMRAVEGAIAHVSRSGPGSFSLVVIGGGKATGICGSGLVDAVASLLDDGAIDPTGRIDLSHPGVRYPGSEVRIHHPTGGLVLTQRDIRELQLAKAAIASGVEILADYAGITVANIARVYLTGAFGSYLRVESAARIGLLPPVLADRCATVENGALTGAFLLATSKRWEKDIATFLQRTRHYSLSSHPRFQDIFAEHMFFAGA